MFKNKSANICLKLSIYSLMRILDPLIRNYQIKQKEYKESNLSNVSRLKEQIKESKKLLDYFRERVDSTFFEDKLEEIYFFKKLKPKIYADFIFYNSQLRYNINKPNTTNSILKAYLKRELKKIESKKRRNLEFYRYYKQGSVCFDHIYFLRENKQLEIFDTELSIYLSTDFYTSHDTLAAEVINYDLITEFYKNEIKKIKSLELVTNSKVKSHSIKTLNWTASKTDLIELVYALKVSGAINTGNINTKELVDVFSSLFNIQLSNYYKTYSEIKNRSTERTKFLKKLAENFQAKLEYDDGL